MSTGRPQRRAADGPRVPELPDTPTPAPRRKKYPKIPPFKSAAAVIGFQGSTQAEWSDEALALVTLMASELKTQATIAAHFGVPVRTWEDHLKQRKGDNPLRLAYETGRAAAEQDKVDTFATMLKILEENPARAPMPLVTALIFFMKAQFGWRDRPDTTINTGPAIQITLPGPMSKGDYYAKLGITAPVDIRQLKDVTPAAPLLEHKAAKPDPV